MPEFKDLKSLFKYIEKMAEQTLVDEVADTVRFEEQRQIEDIVYKAYTPFEYERRRYENEGLQDPEMMIAEIGKTAEGVVLSVINIAKGQDQEDLYIAPLVEYGDNEGYGEYQYKYNRNQTSWKYRKSRPFTRATIEALKRSGKHVESFIEGMRARGINIE